jgi:hypothetical protein
MQEVIAGFWRSKRKLIMGIAFILGAAIVVAVVLLIVHWPFSRQAVLKDLESASLSSVTAESYHGTYFPRPGCELENVTFRHGSQAGIPPLITVRKLRIEGSFLGLFTKHLRQIHAEGLRVQIPRGGSNGSFGHVQRSSFAIDDMAADGAVLEFLPREPGQQPLRFSFRSFSLGNVGGRGPAQFKARFTNPEPPGEITTKGNFGPWSAESIGKTAVSGDYVFEHADLGTFGGISGLLSSSGKFSGVLEHIEAQGVTEVPDFRVRSSSHQQDVKAEFHALVNGTNGDTFVQRAEAKFRHTTVSFNGSVARNEGAVGKSASFDLAVKNGRIEDLVLLFVRSPRAPMSGSVSLRAEAKMPPEKERFLKKLQMEGDFGIEDSTFAKSETQQEVNHLSAGATPGKRDDKQENASEDSETVVSDLKGHVVLNDGTAKFTSLSFSVPGALAQVEGTYSLLTERIDFRGTLKTLSQPSNSTHGMKSLMMKFLDPIFKKKKANYIVPVKITGTYSHPSFALDLHDTKAKKAASAGEIKGK